jgi:hypothetical protein
MADEQVLFYEKVNSIYKKSTQFAHFYITNSKIILTKHSTWNLFSHVGTGLAGYLDGENKPLFEFDLSKLKSIKRVRFKLNGKVALFTFEDDEIGIAFDSPKKAIESLKAYIPSSVEIDFN